MNHAVAPKIGIRTVMRIHTPRSAVDETFTSWVSKGVHVVEEPHDDVFGRTFVVTDPDGNLIRVSPVD